MTDRRTPQSNPAGNLAAAIAASGISVASVAEATGISSLHLTAFLNGTGDISVEQLLRAGGFLRLSPTEVIGAAA